MPVEIFCCYAHEDRKLLDKLRLQLIPLERDGLIGVWADTAINGGADWEKEINKHLNSAHIILLLVSQYFTASEYCYSKEMKQAMERHEAGEAYVVPVILGPIMWQSMPFGKLQALPKDGIPITSSKRRKSVEALFEVAEGIKRTAFNINLELEAKRKQEASERDSQVKQSTEQAYKSHAIPIT